jgi:ankyrin repeat protein
MESEIGLHSCLMSTCLRGDLEAAKHAVAEGASINKYMDWCTVEIAGSDRNNWQEYNGMSPLHMAALHGHAQVVLFLLRSGAELEVVELSYRRTPLLCAASKGHAEAVDILLQAGADTRACNVQDSTALYVAGEGGYNDVIQMLARAGADVDARSRSGYTALFRAAMRFDLPTVTTLLEVGADVNYVPDKTGIISLVADASPFQRLGRAETIQVLIDAGASIDPSFMNELGRLYTDPSVTGWRNRYVDDSIHTAQIVHIASPDVKLGDFAARELWKDPFLVRARVQHNAWHRRRHAIWNRSSLSE